MVLLTLIMATLGVATKSPADLNPLAELANLSPVPWQTVTIHDGFWSPWRERNRKVSLKVAFDNLEKFGNLPNFDTAAAGKRTGFIGPFFADSDVYKVVEAASYTLATDPDPALSAKIDAIIARIGRAQRPDGYLNTYYEVNFPEKRLTNLEDHHELYCAGHLFEAAVAHFQATGRRNLLDIAVKYADFLVNRFAGRDGYPGHPEIELSLVRMAKATDNETYFALARQFIENRGTHFFAKEHNTPESEYDGTYWIDSVPIRDLNRIMGHAVRAGYLLSGATDVASRTKDPAMLAMLDRVWRNMTERNEYVTGGIGSSASNEGFTTDYDLPNLSAYQETCASVAVVMWAHRMNLLTGDGKYADVMENALYNGVLAGVSEDGAHFNYSNPLASLTGHPRQPWFACACCPPNESRTLSGLGRYLYATSREGLWINLYVQGAAQAKVGNQSIPFSVTANYPWQGNVSIELNPLQPKLMSVSMRIPHWATTATAKVNGQAAPLTIEKGYGVIRRTWRAGDKISLHLPIVPRRIAANPNVKEDAGKFALARGPLVYCLEAVDTKAPVPQLAIDPATAVTAKYDHALFDGMTVLKTSAESASGDWQGGLYQPANPITKVPVTLVPYYAWGNRGNGAMEVWVPSTPPAPLAGGPERSATVSLSHTSNNCQPFALNDDHDPISSGHQPDSLCHWWPRKGTMEWAQYSWAKPRSFSNSRVYWFDDTGRGECRLPTGWKIFYKAGGIWKPVELIDSRYDVEKDRWCGVAFKPVVTNALRLEVNLQAGWSAGVHGWRVDSE